MPLRPAVECAYGRFGPRAKGAPRPSREPPGMAPLTSLDSSFLRVETPTAHMHVGWLSHLDLPEGAARLDVGRWGPTIAPRLPRAPRFRQRVVEPALGLGEPEWVDDPRFRLER